MKVGSFIIAFWLLCFACGDCFCEEFLEVYIIPHSHCDVGWKKTVDEYYNQQVHWILHNATDAISRSTYPGVVRKFNWDVQAFFQMWWKDLSESKKNQVRQQVEDRILDFIGFGWVQSDEAVADLFARVVQMTEGHNYIAKEFPLFVDTPRIAWQIDPFGASSITPVLFSLAGYDGLVHERIPRAQQTEWKLQHKLQYEWTGNPSTLANPLWSHNLGDPTNDYCTPGDPPPPGGGPYGFDWEADDDGDPNKDPIITPENIQARAEVLVQIMHTRSKWIQPGVPLLFPFGCDFRFQKAEAQFTNMDQLIYYINSNSTLYNIHLQYGLVSEWFEAVQATKKTWPSYDGDFLPYNNKQNDFWSGFFTSRPDIKRSSRYSESLLRYAEIIHGLALLKNPNNQAILEASLIDLLDSARQNISICQHHDAITGTSPDTTMEDYLHRLRDSDLCSAQVIEETANVVLCNNSENCSEDVSFSLYESAPPTHELPVVNIIPQLCIPLVINNPLAWNQNQFVQIQTNSSNIQLSFLNGSQIPLQITPVNQSSFLVGFILPMSPLEMIVLHLQDSSPAVQTPRTIVSSQTIKISNEYLELVIDASKGLIRSIRDISSGNEVNVDQELIEYYSPNSSAYSMKASSWRVLPADESLLEVTVVQGILFSQVDVTYNSYIQWSARLINGERPDIGRKVDYSVLIGPVVQDTEVSMRFNTNWNTNGVWYSDNGLAMDEHHRVHLPYMDPTGIGSNFHSLKNTAFIRHVEQGLDFSILTAQSAGVSSLSDGQLEVMMHRRCGSWDDRTQVHLFYQFLFGETTTVESYRNQNVQQLEYPPVVLVDSTPSVDTCNMLLDSFQPINEVLPEQIHLFSLAAGNSLAFGKVGNCTSASVAFRLQNLSSNETISVDTSNWIQSCSICGQEERGLTLLPLKNSQVSTSNLITLPPFSLLSYVSSFEC